MRRIAAPPARLENDDTLGDEATLGISGTITEGASSSAVFRRPGAAPGAHRALEPPRAADLALASPSARVRLIPRVIQPGLPGRLKMCLPVG